jgi:hypothetical protein
MRATRSLKTGRKRPDNRVKVISLGAQCQAFPPPAASPAALFGLSAQKAVPSGDEKKDKGELDNPETVR